MLLYFHESLYHHSNYFPFSALVITLLKKYLIFRSKCASWTLYQFWPLWSTLMFAQTSAFENSVEKPANYKDWVHIAKTMDSVITCNGPLQKRRISAFLEDPLLALMLIMFYVPKPSYQFRPNPLSKLLLLLSSRTVLQASELVANTDWVDSGIRTDQYSACPSVRFQQLHAVHLALAHMVAQSRMKLMIMRITKITTIIKTIMLDMAIAPKKAQPPQQLHASIIMNAITNTIRIMFTIN